MIPDDQIIFILCPQLLQRICAHRLQESVAWPHFGRVFESKEVLVNKHKHPAQHLVWCLGADGFDSVQSATSGENTQPPEEPLLGIAKQFVTPELLATATVSSATTPSDTAATVPAPGVTTRWTPRRARTGAAVARAPCHPRNSGPATPRMGDRVRLTHSPLRPPVCNATHYPPD
jgi:hypothetical protein